MLLYAFPQVLAAAEQSTAQRSGFQEGFSSVLAHLGPNDKNENSCFENQYAVETKDRTDFIQLELISLNNCASVDEKECGTNNSKTTPIEYSRNDDPNKEDIPANKVIFEALQYNEREFLKDILRSKVFENYYISTNPCIIYFKNLFRQLKTIMSPHPSYILLHNLEFLKKNCDQKDLFIKSGSIEKTHLYYDKIKSYRAIDYEEKELDIYSLADATKQYIADRIKFFDKMEVKKIIELYSTNEKTNKKKFFIKRLPSLMINRHVFKEIRSIIIKLDQNKEKTGVDKQKSINIWAEVIFHTEIENSKRTLILSDILNVEYDYVPLSFFD